MNKFRTIVKETIIWSFPILANSLEEAHKKAEMALHEDDDEEPLTFENGAWVKLDSRNMTFETKEDKDD